MEAMGCYPLHEAASKGYLQCLRLLLDEGFVPNERDKLGYTPIHLSAKHGKLSCLKELVKRGGDLKELSFEEKDALGFAKGHLQTENWIRKELGMELIPDPNEIKPEVLPTSPEESDDEGPTGLPGGPPQIEGHLWKSSGSAKNKAKGWQKRWFLLRDGALFYFKNNKDPKALNAVRMKSVKEVKRADDITKKSNSLQIVTPYRTFYCYALTEDEANLWVQSIFEASQYYKVIDDSEIKSFVFEREDSDDDDDEESNPEKGVNEKEADTSDNNNELGSSKGDDSSLFGFLFKSGGKNPGHWQKRWVVLDKYNLCYYRKQGDVKPAGILPLTTLESVLPGEEATKKEFSFAVVTPERTFYFYGANAAHRDQWLKAIETNMAKVKEATDGSGDKTKTGELARRKPIVKPVEEKKEDEKSFMRISSDSKLPRAEALDKSPLLNRVTSQSQITHPGSPVMRRVPHGKIVKEGFMWKTPGSKKKPGNWQRRWFVLREDRSLSYYKQPKDGKPAGAIDLVTVTEIKEENNVPNIKNAFHISTPDRVYYIYTSSSSERDAWIEVLQNPTIPE